MGRVRVIPRVRIKVGVGLGVGRMVRNRMDGQDDGWDKG
jgi:hypothetical protein